MSTRRPFTPPAVPDAPDVGRLQVQRATRGVRERGRWFAAFSLCLGGTFGWAWLWGFALVPDVQLLACVAVPGFLALGVGLVYFGLPLVDEVVRWGLFVAASRQEIALRWMAVERRVKTEEAWSARWNRQPRQRERVIKVRVGEPGNVAKPVENIPEIIHERATQHLPALPSPTPYYGTDAYLLVDAALTGQPFGVNSPLGRRLGKARHAAALDRLLGAEVLLPPAGKGQGPALAPGFARFRGAPALGHAAVAAWLGAPPGEEETLG